MSTPVGGVLLAIEERGLRRALRRSLEERGLEVVNYRPGAEALSEIRAGGVGLAIVDLVLAGGAGPRLIEEVGARGAGVAAIAIAGRFTVEEALAATRLGAVDYLERSLPAAEMAARAVAVLGGGAEEGRCARMASEPHGVERILGASAPIEEVRRMVRKIAQSEATTILLLGESGVGKGLVARALHFESRVAERPFMNINCTALADTLLESELFGHEKGAFTDAKIRKLGLLELAHGGTVFLDEIGDLAPRLQGKLLGFLEEKTFRRVGGTRDLTVDVRIVAATNRNLERAVRAGEFRPDLYYRLAVIPMYLPALRERCGDIPILSRHFLDSFNAEFGRALLGFEEEAARWIESYTWPGNVRELRNAIERAVLLAEGPWIGRRDLPREVVPGGEGCDPAWRLTLPAEGLVLEDLERSLIEQALRRTGGNRTRAAHLLGLRRDQIRYRIAKFGLNCDEPGFCEEEG